MDAPRVGIGGQGERVAVPFLPELEQGGGKERQPAGLVLDVGDERVHQLRLDLEAGAGGR